MPEKNKPVKLIKSSLLFKRLHKLPTCLNISEETKDVDLMYESKHHPSKVKYSDIPGFFQMY